MRKNRRLNAFTMIEMLTVIAIIGILAGLLFPAISGAMKKAKVAQAKSDISSIESALRAYYLEYGKWPNGNGTLNDISYGAFGSGPYAATATYCPNYRLMNTLGAIADTDNDTGCGNGNNSANPRKIAFLQIPAKSQKPPNPAGPGNDFVDPWGHPYQITLDTDYDNICVNLAGTWVSNVPTPLGTGAGPGGVTNRTAVVWSFGIDGTGGTGDDITSW